MNAQAEIDNADEALFS
jgi:dynein light chain Tctex-type 1